MSEDLFFTLLFGVLPGMIYILMIVGDGSPVEGVRRIFTWILGFFVGAWSLVRYTGPLFDSIPEQVDYTELNKLLEWNRLWEPPERGDFYVWDPRRQVFEEIPLPTVEALGSGNARLKDSAKEAGYEVGDRRYKTLEEARRSHSDVKAAETSGRTKGSIFCDGCGEFRRPMLDGLCGACYRKQSQYAPQRYALGETVKRVGSWCKGCRRDAGGAEYCDRCKRVGFDDLPEDSMIRLFTIDGRTAHCTRGQLRQARRRYWFELGERGLDAAMYAAMQVLIGDEILEDLQRLPDKTQYEVIEQIHKLVTDGIPGEKRCDWCGDKLGSISFFSDKHPERKFCNDCCMWNYHTEP